jgi:catechol 2,3-dioxygenase
MSELKPPDLAHLGPVEIFTPKPQESLEFFTEMMGMEVQHQEGQSAYLRGWDDYQVWSLKLTEAALPRATRGADRGHRPR